MPEEFNLEKFIEEKTREISSIVGDALSIMALSGGTDSSVVAMLNRLAGIKIENYFIDDSLRKKDEYIFVRDTFAELGIEVHCYNIQDKMFGALKGVSDNIEKRVKFRTIFYKSFGELIQKNNATYLFQGTNQADKKMKKKGQLQHNVGVDYKKYGIKHIVEPLSELYKPQIRKVARAIGLPKEISERMPFPGPGLAIRCLGKITKEKINLARDGLAVAEEELACLNPFQVVVAVSGDKVCSMIGRAVPDKYMLIVRAVKSEDAMTGEGIIPSQELKNSLEEKLMRLPKVGRVLWDPTNKPPATIEYI